MGCHFLLQGIFPTQGSNLHLLCLLYSRQSQRLLLKIPFPGPHTLGDGQTASYISDLQVLLVPIQPPQRRLPFRVVLQPGALQPKQGTPSTCRLLAGCQILGSLLFLRGWCFKTIACFRHLCAFRSVSVQWRMRKPVSNWLRPLCHQHGLQTELDAQSCLKRSLEKPCSPHTWILPQPCLFSEELTTGAPAPKMQRRQG